MGVFLWVVCSFFSFSGSMFRILFCVLWKAIVVIYIHIQVSDSICFNLKHYVFKTFEDENEGVMLCWVIVTNILIDMKGFSEAIMEFSIIHKATRLNSSFGKWEFLPDYSTKRVSVHVGLWMLLCCFCYCYGNLYIIIILWLFIHILPSISAHTYVTLF